MWSFALRDRGLKSLGENVHKERLQFPWLETMAGAKSACAAEEDGEGDPGEREKIVRVKGDIGNGSRERLRMKNQGH